jgi:hypothetical protein
MNIRHFAIALLSVPLVSNAAWTVQTVDSGQGVGDVSSLALSAAGVPHISYYRPNSTAGFANLYYATKSGSTWTTESIYDGFNFGGAGELTSIALTNLGNPVVTFTRTTTFLSYSIRSGGSWSTTTPIRTDGGGYSSLLWHGTEAAPTPMAAYYDSATQYLKLAYYDGAWNSSTLDNTAISGEYCSISQVGTYVGIAYVDNGKLGYQESPNDGANWAPYSSNAFPPFSNITNVAACALALAPATVGMDLTLIRAHIIYYDSNTARFYYETNNTDTGPWATPEIIKQSALNTVAQIGVSIAVGSDGIPQVAFLDYSTNQISYSKRVNGAWTTPEVVDSSTLGGANCAIKLDANNLPHIAYGVFPFDSGSSTYPVSAVKFASFSNSSGGGGGAPKLTVLGKAKRVTTRSKLKIKGIASNAVAVRWKLGKKAPRKVAVSGGKWTASVSPLAVGRNKVKFQAVSSTGAVSAIKTLAILRKK